MTRSIKILFVVAGAMMILSGPAFLLGIFMAYDGMRDFSPELNPAEYFNSLLAKWVAPPLVMFVLGVNLVIVGLIAWYCQRQKMAHRQLGETSCLIRTKTASR